jgi:integrase
MEMQRKFNFTKKTLATLSTPHQGKQYYYDLTVRGLVFCITANNVRTFYLYRKVKGRPERIRIGRFPDFSVENARGEASRLNHQIERGINPNEEKKKLQDELTLGALFQLYLERHAKVHKKSWQEDVNQYRRYLLGLAKRKISSIKKVDIMNLQAKLGSEHGAYAANRTLALLKTLFNKAISWGWEGANPTSAITKFREKSRDRFLQSSELPAFFKALEEESNQDFRDFFYICLLTGARRSNVLAMEWGDIDFAQSTWRIPETKNGEAQIIPLSPDVTSMLQTRHQNKQNNWVFPSPTSRSGHLEEPKSAWRRICQRANLKDLRLHDLRRTLGSWQAATGANAYIIGKSLGHKSQQATAIYARLNVEPVRESVNKAVQAIQAAAKLSQ